MAESPTPKGASAVPTVRSATGPRQPAASAAGGPVERHRFDVVIRGYDRTAVDEHVARTTAELAAAQRELAESERRRASAEQHASATESEIRALRSDQGHNERTPPEESFGYRAEKLLRLAEQEAAEARSTAAREASGVVEQARADAELHRHEVEQTLITRSSMLDQQAAQRTAELQEREQQIAAQLATARSEIDNMYDAARRAGEQHRKQAEGEAEAVRARAAHAAQRVRDQAEQEVVRFAALRDDARAEITRLVGILAAELNASTAGERAADPAAGGPAGGPARHSSSGDGPDNAVRPDRADGPAGRPDRPTGRSDRPSGRPDHGDAAGRGASVRAAGR